MGSRSASELTDEERAWLEKFFTTYGPGRRLIQLRRGQRLFVRGSPADHVHLILKGQIKLDGPNQSSSPIYHPNDWLFEHAHELGHVYLQTAIAMTDVTAVEFKSGRGFSELLAKHPALQMKFVEDAARRVADLNQTRPTADKRLAQELLAMFEGKTETMMIKTSPTRLSKLASISRTRSNAILKRFLERGLLTKVDKDHYRLHRAQLKQFLGAT
jgi:CRP-like cAMP-binding protein